MATIRIHIFTSLVGTIPTPTLTACMALAGLTLTASMALAIVNAYIHLCIYSNAQTPQHIQYTQRTQQAQKQIQQTKSHTTLTDTPHTTKNTQNAQNAPPPPTPPASLTRAPRGPRHPRPLHRRCTRICCLLCSSPPPGNRTCAHGPCSCACVTRVFF